MNPLTEALHKQQEYYENLLNHFPADIAIYDTDQRFRFINTNDHANESLRTWLIGKTEADYIDQLNISPALAEARKKYFDIAVQQNSPVEFEEVTENNNGKKVYHLRRYYPVINKHHEIEEVIGYGIDITDIRQREIEVQRRAGMFRSLVNGMNQLVVAIHSDLTIIFANKKWIEVIGVKEQNPIDFSNYLLEGAVLFMEVFKAIQKNHELPITENRYVVMENVQGKKLTLEYNIVPFFESGSDQKSWAIFFSDITQQLKAESELKNIAEQERKLNELKSSFVNLVSHELRTPLSVILSSSELIELAGKEKGFSAAKYTNRINGQIERMTQLLNDFLFVSKIESRSIQAVNEKIAVQSLMLSLFHEYYQPWRDGRSIQYYFKGAAETVEADPAQLKHILVNLIDNSFKYSPSASAPVIKVYTRAKSWSILIIDAGIGIPAEDIKKLFAPFVRGSNVLDIEGSGIGLMIVKYFLELNNGTVHIKSTVGKGTVFLVEFKQTNKAETDK